MPDEDLLPLEDQIEDFQQATQPKLQLDALLPAAPLSLLSAPERLQVAEYQRALAILGPAAGSVMTCPGMQHGVQETLTCPHYSKCPLIRMGKAVPLVLCLLEKDYMERKFAAWCQQFGKEPDSLSEVERSQISELVVLDIEEMRCVNVLSDPRGGAARLHHKNVKDVNPENGAELSWEWVIHTNAELLDRIQTQRRMILKDWELTPEMQTRKARLEGKNRGTDQATIQSARADRIRRLGTATVIEG